MPFACTSTTQARLANRTQERGLEFQSTIRRTQEGGLEFHSAIRPMCYAYDSFGTRLHFIK